MALIPETIFLESSLIWHSQVRFSSICTPRDFTVETCFIGNWLIAAMGFAVKCNNLCLEPISRNSVFAFLELVCWLQATHEFSPDQDYNTTIYFINIATSKSNTSISSAYILGWECWRQLGRSFIYNRNRRGPRIVPCGTFWTIYYCLLGTFG